MMAASRLYTRDLLALAVELARYPLTASYPHRAELRSPVCGATIDIGLDVDASGYIDDVGARVTACAVGQAAAAICFAELAGQDLPALDNALTGIAAWLDGTAQEPGWPRLGALAVARLYPARHGAILLPWRAAQAALFKAGPQG